MKRTTLRNKPELKKILPQEVIAEEDLENDVVVRLLPRRKYTLSLEVKHVRKGELKIVKPGLV